MNVHPFENTHVVISSQRPFDAVIQTLEALLGGVASPERWDTFSHELAETHASREHVTHGEVFRWTKWLYVHGQN